MKNFFEIEEKEIPQKEEFDYEGYIDYLISLSNQIKQNGGTETIIGKWLNGSKESAIKFLVICIKVNKPETKYNTEQMAKETIEKYIEDNF
jgi:hypothetical protein